MLSNTTERQHYNDAYTFVINIQYTELYILRKSTLDIIDDNTPCNLCNLCNLTKEKITNKLTTTVKSTLINAATAIHFKQLQTL